VQDQPVISIVGEHWQRVNLEAVLDIFFIAHVDKVLHVVRTP
jgi:hypothetical protein